MVLFILVSFPLPLRWRYRLAMPWVRFAIWLVKHVLGITYRLIGAENIPPHAAIVFSKHQSAWETLALRVFLPPHSVVIKKELLYFPIWGWSLLTLKSIVINRKNQRASLKSLLEQGTHYLNEGLNVLIFPEGTRSGPGT